MFRCFDFCLQSIGLSGLWKCDNQVIGKTKWLLKMQLDCFPKVD